MTLKEKLKEKRGKLEQLRKDLHEIFEAAKTDEGELDLSQADMLEGDSKARAEKVANMNQEMTDLSKEIEDLVKAAETEKNLEKVHQQLDEPAGNGNGQIPHPPAGPQQKSIGTMFTESEAFTEYKGGGQGPQATIDIELKTLFQTTAGWPPETTRTGRIVEYPTRPIQVTDLIPQTTTTQNAIVYMEETVFTNAAAETAEGGTYPEGALKLEEKSSPVKKVAVWIPVTDEQVEDEPRVRTYLDNRLRFMLQQRLDGQILTGDGTGSNLTGILNTANIQTLAAGEDPVPDAIYKAMTKIRVTGRAMPGATILHPNDWQGIRLLKTADGIYIWGSPADPGPERIWGLAVTQSDAETENTGLVGDFQNFSELANRRGIDMQITNAHSDYFINGKQAVRADLRSAFLVYRPQAFCTVTGI